MTAHSVLIEVLVSAERVPDPADARRRALHTVAGSLPGFMTARAVEPSEVHEKESKP